MRFTGKYAHVRGKDAGEATMTTDANGRQSDNNLCPLMTVKDVAKVLGVHVRTVWRLSASAEMGEGNFPRPVRIAAKTIRWRRDDMESYLNGLVAEAT